MWAYYMNYIISKFAVTGLIGKSLGEKKCESIALILSCSGLSIQLCGKDEKVDKLIASPSKISFFPPKLVCSLQN